MPEGSHSIAQTHDEVGALTESGDASRHTALPVTLTIRQIETIQRWCMLAHDHVSSAERGICGQWDWLGAAYALRAVVAEHDLKEAHRS